MLQSLAQLRHLRLHIYFFGVWTVISLVCLSWPIGYRFQVCKPLLFFRANYVFTGEKETMPDMASSYPNYEWYDAMTGFGFWRQVWRQRLTNFIPVINCPIFCNRAVTWQRHQRKLPLNFISVNTAYIVYKSSLRELCELWHSLLLEKRKRRKKKWQSLI